MIAGPLFLSPDFCLPVYRLQVGGVLPWPMLFLLKSSCRWEIRYRLRFFLFFSAPGRTVSIESSPAAYRFASVRLFVPFVSPRNPSCLQAAVFSSARLLFGKRIPNPVPVRAPAICATAFQFPPVLPKGHAWIFSGLASLQSRFIEDLGPH